MAKRRFALINKTAASVGSHTHSIDDITDFDADDYALIAGDTFTGAVSITTGGLSIDDGGIVVSNGGLTLDGAPTNTDTPVGSTVQSQLDIPAKNLSNFEQAVAVGILSGSADSSRVFSIFDARTGTHQPSIGVFNPAETDLFGISWEGSDTAVYLKSLSANIAVRIDSTDIMAWTPTFTYVYTDLDIDGDVTADNLNVSNWDTAFGWGNHASAGYLTAVPATESPPKATELSAAVDLDTLQSAQAGFYFQNANADTPGNNYPVNHAGSLLVQKSAGTTQVYITYPETGNHMYFRSKYNTAFSSWHQVWASNDFSSSDITNWDTAFGWGNHASAGYALLSGATFTGTVSASSTVPRFRWIETDASANETRWQALAESGNWSLRAYLDNETSNTIAMQVVRTGITIDEIELNATLLDFNGNVDISGSITAPSYNNSDWDTAYGWGDHASAGYAADSAVVHIAGTETITGNKTFSADPSITGTRLYLKGFTANGGNDFLIGAQPGATGKRLTLYDYQNSRDGLIWDLDGKTWSFRGPITINSDGPAAALNLKSGSADALYIQWYPDAAAQNTRRAYMGFASAGSEVFDFDNEYAGGYFRFLDPLVVYGSSNYLQVTGGSLYLADSSNTDHGRFYHDGTDFNTTFANTTQWDINGQFYIQAANGTTGITSAAQVDDHAGTPRDVGFNVLPVQTTNSSVTLAAQHCGQIFLKTDTTGRTITIPASSSVDFPVGGMCTLMNVGSSGNIVVNDDATATCYVLNGVTVTDIAGSATVSPGGVASLYRYSTTVYYLWGNGVAA